MVVLIGEDKETADGKTEDGIPEKLGEGAEGKVRIETEAPASRRKKKVHSERESGPRIKAKGKVPFPGGEIEFEIYW